MKKKIACFLAVLLLCTACTARPAPSSGAPAPNGSGSSGTSGEAPLVYRPVYLELPPELQNASLNSLQLSGGRVYGLLNDYDPDTQTNACGLANIAPDGTDYRFLPFDLPTSPEAGMGSITINSAFLLQDGTILALGSVYDETTYQPVYSVLHLDAQGGVLANSPVIGLPQGVSYLSNPVAGGDGNLYVSASGASGMVLALSDQGQTVAQIPMEGRVSALALSGDGRIAALCTGDTGGTSLYFLDAQTQRAEAAAALPASPGQTALYSGDGDSLVYGLLNGQVHAYDAETGAFVPLFSFLDLDYSASNVQALLPIGPEQFLMVGQDWDIGQTELARIEKQAYVETRTVLTMGVFSAGTDLVNAVVQFNRRSDRYRVELTAYNEGGDYEAARSRFQAQMATGDIPDILDAGTLPFETLAGRGFFADLYPLLDADESLSRDDLVPAALRAMETDGKLYFIAPSFQIRTLVGLKENFDGKSGMTVADLVQKLDQHPGMAAIGHASQETALTLLTIAAMDDFIDPETGVCSFDSDAFVQLLELAAQAPASLDENAPRAPVALKNGDALTMVLDVGTVNDFQTLTAELGDSYTVAGLPGENRDLAIALFGNKYAISASCADPQGAWSFLSYYLQRNGIFNFGLPILTRDLEQDIESAAEPSYVTDENGNQKEVPKMSVGFGDGAVLDIYAVTEAEQAMFRQLIDAITTRVRGDDTVFEILSEEAAPFFAGQKTAQDAANVIQNRVQTYISENR